MKGKLRGNLDRRQEIRIKNRNKTSLNTYNWIKCLPKKEKGLDSDRRSFGLCESGNWHDLATLGDIHPSTPPSINDGVPGAVEMIRQMFSFHGELL